MIKEMACGTLVASTDCPFEVSEILDNERLVRLYPVGDHKGAAKSIIHTLGNPTSRSREMLTWESSRFSEESGVKAYAELCQLSK